MNNSWRRLGAIKPSQLVEARSQLHYAAQIVSGVGRCLLPPKKDDSHTNLEWLADLDALASRPTEGEPAVRAALLFKSLEVRLLGPAGESLGDLALAGRDSAEAYQWLKKALNAAGVSTPDEITPPDYDLPKHPLPEGAKFSLDDEAAFAEMAAWFSNALIAVSEAQAAAADASPVRVWPHHFDMATLIELDKDKSVEAPRSIGVGLSPGDEHYEEPYWYVGPYPYPKDSEWPSLGGAGHWHTDKFTAAVLPGTSLADTADQAGQVAEFISSAVAGCREMLEAAA